MTDKPLSILMLACGGSVSHGMLKAIASGTIPCRIVGADIAPTKVGLYTVDRAYISPWAHEARFLDWLIDLCKTESIDAVLCGAEPVIKILAEHAEKIRDDSGAVCIVTDLATFLIGDDKLRCCAWLEEHGFNSPPAAASEDREGLEGLVEANGFPLIAKPRVGGSATGHIRVENHVDLEYVSHKEHFLVQAYIGDDESEFTVGCFCDRDGELRASIVFRRLLSEGTSVFVEAGEFPDVRSEAERIVRALKPRGPCNVQLRLHEGQPVCFELNVRFSGTTPIRAQMGFNEVEAAIRHFVLGEEEISLPHVTEGIMTRYWNEMYVSPEAYAKLKSEGHLDSPGDFPTRFEDYGHRR